MVLASLPCSISPSLAALVTAVISASLSGGGAGGGAGSGVVAGSGGTVSVFDFWHPAASKEPIDRVSRMDLVTCMAVSLASIRPSRHAILPLTPAPQRPHSGPTRPPAAKNRRAT